MTCSGANALTCSGRFTFGQHHGVIAGAFKGLEVELLVGGAELIDAHHGAGRIELDVDERFAGGGPVGGGASVLEVEDHDIRCGSGFFVPLRTVGRAEKPCRAGILQTHQSLTSAGRIRTMVLRLAVATISPC